MSLAAFGGSLRYEFVMQIRRPSLWISMLLIAIFMFRSFRNFYLDRFPTGAVALGLWAQPLVLFCPLVAGLLLADRFSRDRKIHVDEILMTTESGISVRLAGKYLGSTLATLMPIFVIYLGGAVLILNSMHDLGDLPLALALFVATLGLATLFVGAFSIACTIVIWPVLYQFLFVGYWFWGNLLNPHLGIPTLNSTLLVPTGRYVRAAFFTSTLARSPTYSEPSATVNQGLISLALVVGSAVIIQIAAWRLLVWQQNHA